MSKEKLRDPKAITRYSGLGCPSCGVNGGGKSPTRVRDKNASAVNPAAQSPKNTLPRVPFARMTEAEASMGRPSGKRGLASPPVFATATRRVRKLSEN